MAAPRYMILKVGDAHELARAPNDAIALTQSVLSDEGGDLRAIADLLKTMETCTACSHEGMQRHCTSITARLLGRRLARLIARADARAPTDEEMDSP